MGFHNPITIGPTISNSEMENDIISRITSREPNVYLTSKEETEDKKKFPFKKRLYAIDKITLMNFAGTTFISSVNIAAEYPDEYSKWFSEGIIEGKIEADIILTNPRSQAAKDAADNKMFPKGRKKDTDLIINDNINTLLSWKDQNPDAKLNIRLTDVALPYGIMLAESYQQPELDYMKVDIYAPIPYTDRNRPSFYLYKSNDETSKTFDFLRNNISTIWNKSIDYRELSNIDWMNRSVNIIHRGLIDGLTKEHSITGFYKCIMRKRPMEVDLLFLKSEDGKKQDIVVGRDYRFYSNELEGSFFLSEITLRQLRKLKTDECTPLDGEDFPFLFEETMEFGDFLNFVNGRVPLLIEIKMNYNEPITSISKKVGEILKIIRYYPGKYAFHSANPLVLACIKKYDRLIPCGQITWSFENTNVSDTYKKIHNNFEFLTEYDDRYIVPDFLSCKIQEIERIDYYNKMIAFKEKVTNLLEKKFPIICWTVKTTQERKLANKRDVDNIIVERPE